MFMRLTVFKNATILALIAGIGGIFGGAGFAISESRAGDRMPASFAEKKFSVNFSETDIKDALRLIAKLGGVEIQFDPSLTGKVSYSMDETTLQKTLAAIASQTGLEYAIEDGTVFVEKPASPAGGGGSTRGAGSGASLIGVHTLQVKNTSAKEIAEKMPQIQKTGESVIVDEGTNALIFYGSEPSFRKVREFIEAMDRMPLQIAIEAQIVETSKNFLREVGFNWGDLSKEQALNKHARATGSITTPTAAGNITGKFLLGFIDSRNLEAQLVAAETTGDAKIISRPKVVTLNNKQASIHSGVTYNVKTLSSVTTGDGSGGTSSATGGLQQVSAGLNLQVLPVVVGDGLIRLQINVSNSETNDGLSVDGIPGITDNSATTSIIVSSGNTVTLAGLIKSTMSQSQNRVPLLSQIPILGWFFSSHSNKNLNNELVIFLTPQVIRAPSDFATIFGGGGVGPVGPVAEVISPDAKPVSRAPATTASPSVPGKDSVAPPVSETTK